jgi:hypothetical protein
MQPPQHRRFVATRGIDGGGMSAAGNPVRLPSRGHARVTPG